MLAPALLYWQLNAPLTDFVAAESSAAVSESYYAPLLRELRMLGVGGAAHPARIEVVPTAAHWEARFVAARVMIARGWERQLDRYRNALFYRSAALSPSEYREWLYAQGISYVALPDAPIDYSGRAEARLVAGGRAGSFLREVWRSPHWRLFAVPGARPLVQPAGRLVRLGGDSFTVQVPRAGAYTVLVRFTSYWALASGSGCVARAPQGDWTRLRAPAAGAYTVRYGFSLSRVLATGPRCR